MVLDVDSLMTRKAWQQVQLLPRVMLQVPVAQHPLILQYMLRLLWPLLLYNYTQDTLFTQASASAATATVVIAAAAAMGRLKSQQTVKRPESTKKKIFPMLRMGNFTMQGVRTLYTTTIDGLKTENINEGITDLGGVDKCLLSLLSVC